MVSQIKSEKGHHFYRSILLTFVILVPIYKSIKRSWIADPNSPENVNTEPRGLMFWRDPEIMNFLVS